MAIDKAELEIFGAQDAFSERWTKLHGLPDIIPADPVRGITRPFSPAEVFSDIAETGLSDQPAWYRASLAIEASTDRNFRRAARTGLLRLLAVNHTMKASRIDSVAELLKTEFGITPQGAAQWLMVDQETRRSLALMFRLQGYQVADEEEIHDEIAGLDAEGKLPSVGSKFSDLRLRPDQCGSYLEEIQKAVGTDRGVVRLAYTIFRYLGFPHENKQFAEILIGKYVYDGKKGDLDPSEVAPFIEKFKEPTSRRIIAEILSAEGVIGLARALNKLPAEIVAREWGDMRLLKDMMDKITDIRAGRGAAASLQPAERLETIRKLEEFGIIMAKKKLSQETVDRIMRLNLIHIGRGATEPGFLEKTIHGMRVPLGGMLGKKPSVKEEEKD